MNENNLLTTKQAAEKLGVSVRRIQALITNDKLKAQKIGRDYMIAETDLDSLEKGKAGRPTKLPKDLEDMLWKVSGEGKSRRTFRNHYFQSRALQVLKKSGELENYKFLFDSESKKDTAVKQTILSELGRIEKEDILLEAARQICDKKSKTADAVVWLRKVRAEHGSFDEVYKQMPNGKLKIYSTDNE